MSFDARDLAITLYPGEQGVEVLWGMACPGCATTGDAPKPNCPAPSRKGCPAPSQKKRAEGFAESHPGLAVLRRQMKESLGAG